MPLSHALLFVAGLVVLATTAGLLWRIRDGRPRRVDGATVLLDELGVRAERVVLLQFSTEMCARCPQVRRMLRSVASARPGIAFAEIDLTHRAELAARHRILTTPTTFVATADGDLVARFDGVPRRADVEAALDELPELEEVS